MKKETLKVLKQLVTEGRISKQSYRTYRGQVLSGDEEGCIKGLIRKGLMREVS